MEINKKLLDDELDTTIHLRCYYGPVHAGISMSPVRNPITREYPSCVRNVDSNGNIILGKNDDPLEYYVKVTDRFIIKDGTDFNLNNEIDRKKWEAIKFSPLIFDVKGKKDEKGNYVVEPYTKELKYPEEKPSAVAVYRVERVVDEARMRNVKVRKYNKALNYIYTASKDSLRIRALLLGKYIKDSLDEEIEEFLVEVAKNDPNKIISLFESNDTKFMIAYTYAKQKGIFRQKGGLITYNDGDIIGRDMDSCIAFMKDPKNKLITRKIFEDLQEVSLRYDDVVTDSIETENRRVDNLKAEAEKSAPVTDFVNDAKEDSEILKALEDVTSHSDTELKTVPEKAKEKLKENKK